MWKGNKRAWFLLGLLPFLPCGVYSGRAAARLNEERQQTGLVSAEFVAFFALRSLQRPGRSSVE
jgi:hypothetical protein